MIIKKINALRHSRKGLSGLYYHIKNQLGGITISRAVFTGEHGQRTIKDRPRIYYFINGKASFMLNTKKFVVNSGDLVVVEPRSTYNFWPISKRVDIILVSELLDLGKLPK